MSPDGEKAAWINFPAGMAIFIRFVGIEVQELRKALEPIPGALSVRNNNRAMVLDDA